MDNRTDSVPPADAQVRAGRRRRRSRGRPAAALAIILLLLVGTAAVAWSWRSDPSDAAAPQSALPTATVTLGTLTAAEERDGTIAFADSRTLTTDTSGRVTWLPATGRTIRRGQKLVRIDEQPTIAMYGTIPAFRALRVGDDGRDVRQLEANLAKLGYSGFTADDTYTAATAAAVADWQDDVGLESSGTVELGQVTFLPGRVQVGARAAAVGDSVQPGAALYEISTDGRVVQVTLDDDDRDLAVAGAPVSVDAGAAGIASGTIATVEAVTSTSGQGPSSTSYLVTITIDEAKKGSDQARSAAAVAAQADGSSVSVSFADREAADVLSVPVKALLALAEGGYGLELVADDGSSTIVSVRTGLFADGRVEVAAEGLAEGDTVRTAR